MPARASVFRSKPPIVKELGYFPIAIALLAKSLNLVNKFAFRLTVNQKATFESFPVWHLTDAKCRRLVVGANAYAIELDVL